MDSDRRLGSALRFEPADGVLVVGNRSAVVDGPGDADIVIGRYVELVLSQRSERPASHVDLRTQELVALADLLALPAGELDERIDRALDRLLGPLVDAGSDRARVWRRLVVAAVLATAVAAGAAWALSDDDEVTSTEGGADETPATATPTTEAGVEPVAATSIPAEPTDTTTTSPPAVPVAPAPTDDGSTVEIIELPDGTTATRTESAPAPPSEGVDIGTAVVYERNEAPPAP